MNPPICGVVSQCPQTEETEDECSGDEEFNTCGSACENTCREPLPRCNRMCVRRCQCPEGTPIRMNADDLMATPICGTESQCNPTTPDPATQCRGDQIFMDCGSACERTCDTKPNQPCTLQCVQKCQCPFDRPILLNPGSSMDPVCVTAEECPECSGGQVYMECGSACDQTCDTDPNQMCTLQCVEKCQCPVDRPILLPNGQCGMQYECPLKCMGDEVPMDCGSACERTCDEPNMACTQQCVRRCQCPFDRPIRMNPGDPVGMPVCMAESDCPECDMGKTFTCSTCDRWCNGDASCASDCRWGCYCPYDKPVTMPDGRCGAQDQCDGGIDGRGPESMCPRGQEPYGRPEHCDGDSQDCPGDHYCHVVPGDEEDVCCRIPGPPPSGASSMSASLTLTSLVTFTFVTFLRQ